MMLLNGTAALRRAGRHALAAALIAAAPAGALAQSTAAPPPAAPQPAPAAPTPATPTSPPTTSPAPPATSPATPDTSTEDKPPPDSSISQVLTIPTRPAVQVSGQATWDEGFKAITDSFAKLNDALARAKLSGAGHPLAVFNETNDSGFKFTAMIPLDKAPDGTPNLGSDVTLTNTPGGKAMRFQHRGAYDDIDSTYEAITAYLDDKGLESKNLFAEEYLDQVKTSEDATLEVDIYVFLK